MNPTRRQALGTLSASAGLMLSASAWGEHTPDTRASSAFVRMPGPPVSLGGAPFFQGDLASLALRKVGWNASLQILGTQTWPRQVRELRDGHADMAPLPAHGTDLYGEFEVARVDFPLRRGLLGVRQLVVRADRVTEFSKLPSLGRLKSDFRLGYGSEWGDLPEMRRQGFRVVTAPSTRDLYVGLQQGDIDFLSRGVNETPNEVTYFSQSGPPLQAVPGLLLFYPLDDCFFVAKRRADLRDALSQGLMRAKRDRSYAQLFQQHFGASLASLAGSRVWVLRDYPRPLGLSLDHYDVLSSGLIKAQSIR
jgi:ABC-type amino acid transport substrate-binding protein